MINGANRRRPQTWIEDFVEYTERFSSPGIFRRWAGISILASVLERRVWVRTRGANLFPNLYVVLTAPPGVGKGNILAPTKRLLSSIPGLHIAPSSVSTASLVDSLVTAKVTRTDFVTKKVIEFNYLTIVATEFGTFMPAYDPSFVNTMTDIYDGVPYADRKRTKDIKIAMAEPQLNLLAGTTPDYLSKFLPEGAWNQGLTSRTIFVYYGKRDIHNLFPDDHDDIDSPEYQRLLTDLQCIHELYGRLEWSDNARDAISNFNETAHESEPAHPKLMHYNSRRVAHLIKLCIIGAMARSDDREIHRCDFDTALEWLTEAESFMSDIFLAMNTGGDMAAMEDCWHFLYMAGLKAQKPLQETVVISFLRERVPSQNIMHVLEIMVRSGAIERTLDTHGFSLYRARPKGVPTT